MKWFIIMLVIVGGYMAVLMASTSMVLDQTTQLQHTYTAVAAQADQIAAGATTVNR